MGKKICDDIIEYCKVAGINILGDGEKTEAMRFVDKVAEDENLNSGDGYESKIVNIPFELFKDFLEWREKQNKRHNKRSDMK